MLKRIATLAALVGLLVAALLAPTAAFAGSGSPAGNNGTVKIAEDGDFDTPSNDPHVGCTFTVEWYGFDKGSDIISTVSFEMQAPTADVALTVTGDTTVFVGGDDNSGGGSAAGLDGREPYTLAFKGAAHPQQGYHIKMTINTPGSNGADKKSKVFWVTGCAETVTPAPKMTMTKTVTDSNDADTLASQGEVLTYSFSVTNTGNVPLTNVKITDAMIPALANGAVCAATLAVGATTTCPGMAPATHAATAGEVAAGKVTNNATATATASSGTNPTATGTASINTYNPPPAGPTPAPSIALNKSVADSDDADTLASQGETLTYSFSVTNTGNVALNNVTITDAKIPALANGAVCVATLAAGATTTCPGLPAATHTTTAGEVAAGKVDNTATASGTSPAGTNVTGQGSATIGTYAPPAEPTPAPSISLSKSVADSDDADSLASQGETLTYSFSVTNTGNVTLTNVTLTDAMIPSLANGAVCVASLAPGATTSCPDLAPATHTVSAADAAHGSVDNTATATGTSPAGTQVSDQDSATITTVAPVVTPDPTPAPAPFTWDWTYADPSCSALTVVYPSNIPDGQANDVNVRILTDKGEVTLNFHNNEGFWGGTTVFDFLSHPKWPAGVTSYSVVWTQVGGTNYHWQGNVKCLIKDDGNPATADAPVGVTTVSGWRSSTVTVRKGQTVSADTVSVSQAGDQDLVLQVLRAGSARGASTWQDVKTVATDGDTAKVTFGRQLRKGTFKYRLLVAGSDTVTGAATNSFTVKVK